MHKYGYNSLKVNASPGIKAECLHFEQIHCEGVKGKIAKTESVTVQILLDINVVRKMAICCKMLAAILQHHTILSHL